MRHTLLLTLPALQEVRENNFRTLKYSLFPPLSLLTLAGMTPESRFRILVRDEHVESAEVDDQDVDLVAMTVYISAAHRAYELADMYRRRGAKVILGGLHPTSMPQEAIRHADAVCIGPAESVWPQILADFERGKLQRFYRGKCAGSAAKMPPPRRDLMNSNAYLVHNTMITSRGCPNNCSFCYKPSFWGEHFYEHRPPAAVEAELASLDGRFVFFLDDNFMTDRRRARELFAIFRNMGTIWQASGSLAAARSPRFLEEAYEAGCRSLFVGIESVSKRNMRLVNKQVNATTDYVEAIRRFHDAGIMINGGFVLGLDHDGPDVFERTLEFAIANKIETGTFHLLMPYPGTRLHARLEAEGRILHTDWRKYDTRHAVFRPLHMTPEQLEAGHRKLYRDFYSFRSIRQRAMGLPGRIKRLVYNVAWHKVDRLWRMVIHNGLLPFLRPVFEQVVAGRTRRRVLRQPRRVATNVPVEAIALTGGT